MKNRMFAILTVLAMRVLAAKTPLSVVPDTEAQYFAGAAHEAMTGR
ncbi:hypothetical protein [Pseudomonas sp. RGM 3321]|nr:hypothetical protein [Pseudomonas sp. RGM 3321]MCJ2375151.1 hypothetical protein [Pseudomonas sp. RGM 3321]